MTEIRGRAQVTQPEISFVSGKQKTVHNTASFDAADSHDDVNADTKKASQEDASIGENEAPPWAIFLC